MAPSGFAMDRPLGELLDTRAKWFVLVTLMLSMFVSALDQSIVATATPRILADLGGFDQLSWVFTIYLLAATAVVPVVGKLSDMFGRKYFLIGGILLFTVASAGAGLSTSMLELIVFRGIQGAGGGMMTACVFATLGDLFSPAERGKYMGMFTGTFSLAAISGPTIGGLLTDNVGWRWCFYVNIPVAIVAITFITMFLPVRKRGGKVSNIDFLGAALLAGATVSLLLGLEWGQKEFGWTGVETLGLFIGSAALVTAFAFQEKRHPQPIFPLMLFKNRQFITANLIVMLFGAGMFGAITYLPTFVQTALGASATASGLVTTPQSLGLLLTSIIGGQMISRTGKYRVLVIAGALCITGGTFLMQTIGVGTAEWHISAFVFLVGLGFGLVMPTLSVVTQNSVSQDLIGVATSGRQFFMQIGQVVGTAIFGVVLATSYGNAFAADVSPDARAAIPAETLAKFEDPTLARDVVTFAAVQASVQALPDGQRLLDTTLNAQKGAIASAIHNIFIGSSIIAVIALLLTFLMKEVPLRRFAPHGARSPEPAGVGVHPPAMVET